MPNYYPEAVARTAQSTLTDLADSGNTAVVQLENGQTITGTVANLGSGVFTLTPGGSIVWTIHTNVVTAVGVDTPDGG